jgi:hypothetical protein
MAVNPIIEYFWRDLVHVYCHGLESSAGNTAPPIFVESLQCGTNRLLPPLPLHMHAENNLPTALMSNIHIG